MKGVDNIKLQRILQICGFARRKADELIFSKKVKVNGKIVTKPWFDVKVDDEITVEGKKFTLPKFEYYVLHKPKGYVTSLYDPKEKNTIKEFFKDKPLKPAGRLDKDVSGVLILTNDGDLIDVLTNAKYGVKKVYIAKITGRVKFEDLLSLKKGIYDKGDFLKLEHFDILEQGFNYSTVKVEMIKGKKHEVKRLFEKIGHKVLELRRIKHGPVSISLAPNPGDMRKIEGEILKKLLKLKRRKKA
ncbi:pseudouridine synthase [Thermosipho melanesiensis]|uniref:Pseudouridine synthase n=2 Tax=Thermosipho melanesiensis TaxID=46541 RepID=A6LK34_THEM4|nr:pseudouridine synthase [Thermosipho melanesiensis]ABR30285.1 pseudouridine synthase [Thermosipho melanesiensis BI429]APT73463.1 pseudouridine synthase [Thermosipho melanesiensis]OOC37408.1 pseudouridine synthase [Thermosipho melanesiensis]OOC39770.1 pseudouridine synthase [Thermosipho melanesiensis]OOC39875.1 pseudouridine synthase [Thermosipho melanesiensis]